MALLRKMNRANTDLNGGPQLRRKKGFSHFLRMVAHVLRQQVSVNVDTSPCHTKWNNFYLYTEQTKKLPKELLNCWAGIPSSTKTTAGGCIAPKIIPSHFAKRNKKKFVPNMVQCTYWWPFSGSSLSADMPLVMYGIPPTRFEITPPLNAEPLFHFACWLANLPLFQTTAHAFPSSLLSVGYLNTFFF